ncbi:MAG: hypothetical protein AAF709_10590 [Pseudomonadota bacterium]
MADEANNLVLEHLRAIRGGQEAARAEVRARLDSIDMRLLALETRITSLHQTNGEFRYRFERIERRLDLANADEH